MREGRLRDLAILRPAANRIFFTGLWFRDHNNARYAELLPRLRRVDAHLLRLSDRRLLRRIEYRAFRASHAQVYRVLLGAASRRYRFCLTVDLDQIPYFDGSIVADIDDPTFSRREVELLRCSNVKAYVVTSERAARRFQELGVTTPYHIIPQGAAVTSVDPAQRAAAEARRGAGELVVGYIAAWLLSSADRGGENPLYNADHLLDLWDRIHVRVPHARLWLVGHASRRIRERCSYRSDIVVFGRLERADALAHVASFDVALYPRTADQGIQAAKLAEYIAFGVPTVSYDYEVAEQLRTFGAGVLVCSSSEFVNAVVDLLESPERRAALSAAAGAAKVEIDWDVLADRYEREVLDRYFRSSCE